MHNGTLKGRCGRVIGIEVERIIIAGQVGKRLNVGLREMVPVGKCIANFHRMNG
jgi:hypothetical protein